ncbi:MAG: hypothetical protein AB7F22_09170 [Reyranella sp.]|uniref:hypothetical protein n=1 Tax=Reyranella sp. TaxID=1929291 RepID=UPI003D0B7266
MNKTDPFIKLPLAVVDSDAWRTLSINARRFIDFLMSEHIRHYSKKNGQLLAPRRQLEQFGIGARHVSGAIEEAVGVGLVDVKRGVGKRPNHYALNWLALHDGTQPEARWLSMGSVATSEGKSLPMTSLRKHQGYPKGSHKSRSDFRREVTKPVVTSLRAVSAGKHLYREDSYRGGNSTDLSGEGHAAEHVNGQADGEVDHGQGDGDPEVAS